MKIQLPEGVALCVGEGGARETGHAVAELLLRLAAALERCGLRRAGAHLRLARRELLEEMAAAGIVSGAPHG